MRWILLAHLTCVACTRVGLGGAQVPDLGAAVGDAAAGDAAAGDAVAGDAVASDASALDGDTTDFAISADAEPPDGAAPISIYGLDCQPEAPSSLAPDSPRILVLGKHGLEIAAHLQGLLSSDPAFSAPVVTGLPIYASPREFEWVSGDSLMNFYYQPDGRDARLAPLAGPWSYVVLEDSEDMVLRYPQLYFEGVRTVGCLARAAGAKPIVFMNWRLWPHYWSTNPGENGALSRERAYRVANGTHSIVAPVGYATESVLGLASADGGSWLFPPNDPTPFIAAATLYSTLTGRDAGETNYLPSGITAEQRALYTSVALSSVVSEAATVHYKEPFRGPVQLRNESPGGDFWFMDSGTSSEQIWYDRMQEILPAVGLVPRGTQIGYTNPQKSFDAAALSNALPYFQQQQYRILFARAYTLDASQIATSGTQSDLQVQIWDRHADSDPSDGTAAVEMMEWMLTYDSSMADQNGLAFIPYHLMFSKMKTMRPSIQLLTDGVHATYPVGYGLATMSVVSRTGLHVPTSGLDSDTTLAAELGEETIRQLSAMSVSGAFVPDDPDARPTP